MVFNVFDDTLKQLTASARKQGKVLDGVSDVKGKVRLAPATTTASVSVDLGPHNPAVLGKDVLNGTNVQTVLYTLTIDRGVSFEEAMETLGRQMPTEADEKEKEERKEDDKNKEKDDEDEGGAVRGDEPDGQDTDADDYDELEHGGEDNEDADDGASSDRDNDSDSNSADDRDRDRDRDIALEDGAAQTSTGDIRDMLGVSPSKSTGSSKGKADIARKDGFYVARRSRKGVARIIMVVGKVSSAESSSSSSSSTSSSSSPSSSSSSSSTSTSTSTSSSSSSSTECVVTRPNMYARDDVWSEILQKYRIEEDMQVIKVAWKKYVLIVCNHPSVPLVAMKDLMRAGSMRGHAKLCVVSDACMCMCI